MEIDKGVAEADNTLRDHHNFSDDTKADSIIVLLFIQNNLWFKNKLKHAFDVKFIFDSACLSASLGDKGLFSSANILQIASVVRRDVFLLFLLCS